MDRVNKYFQGFPSQEKVAALLIRYGISVKEGRAFCGEIEQSDSAIGRAAGVDRRVVRSTLMRISSIPELDAIFSKLQSMLSMVELAPEIDCSSMVIIPTDAKMPGILASITSTLYENGMSVRLAIVDDSGDREKSVLLVVVDGKIPPEVIPRLKSCRGVASIIIK
ncbi:ACT domain-containing protein [Candidatus Methanarcanum hacksteinii]|uniref:ACT domain-containing protein n=1 Tax=Candidatus Methanarcanum hacksteinii TaxID=2911857 RepID=UPI0037DD334F